MVIGRHVYESNGKYFNLTTKTELPLVSTKEELESQYFLEGQEEDAIHQALHLKEVVNPHFLSLTVIPTWRCNLRCTHCFVSHKLKKNGDNIINVDNLVGFLIRARHRYSNFSRLSINFIGGEPTLNADLCISIIEKMPSDFNVTYHMTTNGVMLDDKILKLYNLLTDFMVSIDGIAETHNKQRISLNKEDTYDIIYDNIRKLVAAGLRDKLKVQASLSPEFINPQIGREFYKRMLMAGVKLDKILFGHTSPNRINPSLRNEVVNALNNKLFFRPCCKYRIMQNLVIDHHDSIYADYFEDESTSLIGHLSDDLESLEQRHSLVIKGALPVLNDQKCLKCPVVGACWGYCANVHNHYKPSEFCDQPLRHQNVMSVAAKGKLAEAFKDANAIT